MILTPLILLSDLLLLLRSKVILDIEYFPDLLRRLPPDKPSDRLAGDVKKRLNIQVVRRQDQVEQLAVAELAQEVLVKVAGGPVDGDALVGGVGGVGVVVLAVLDHTLHGGPGDVGDGDGGGVVGDVLEHVLEGPAHLGDLDVDGVRLVVTACECYFESFSRHCP